MESASSINYAVHLFLAGDFDLIVLCHSLSLEQRARLTAAIRASGSYVSILPLAPPSQEGTASNLKRLLRDIEAALKRSVKPYDPRTADDLGRRPMAYGQDVVLYVAADPERVSLRRRELRSSGIVVLAAKDIFEALKLFSMGIADAVVFEEANLMNSRLAVRKMRELNCRIPLLLCSCPSTLRFRNAKIFDRCIPAGASPDALTSALREVLPGTQVVPDFSTMNLLQFESEVRH